MSDYADNLRRSMINKTRRFMRMVQEMQEKDDAALREQVIRMAREAGLMDWNGQCVLTDGQLERFFHLAAAAGANAALEAAARQALEALEYGQHTLKQVSENQWESRGELAMHALRAALARPSPATLIDPRGSLGEPIV